MVCHNKQKNMHKKKEFYFYTMFDLKIGICGEMIDFINNYYFKKL